MVTEGEGVAAPRGADRRPAVKGKDRPLAIAHAEMRLASESKQALIVTRGAYIPALFGYVRPGIDLLASDAADDLVAHTAALGKTLAHDIEALGHPLVDHVRGRGLLQGIVLTAPKAKAAEAAAREAGFLVNAAAPEVIRLAPPLIVTEDQLGGFVGALSGILDVAAEAT